MNILLQVLSSDCLCRTIKKARQSRRRVAIQSVLCKEALSIKRTVERTSVVAYKKVVSREEYPTSSYCCSYCCIRCISWKQWHTWIVRTIKLTVHTIRFMRPCVACVYQKSRTSVVVCDKLQKKTHCNIWSQIHYS